VNVTAWGIRSLTEVEKIKTTCDCVQARLAEVGDEKKKSILVVTVKADTKMSRNASLAVQIEAVLVDGSSKSLSFDFTHVAPSAM
jgi:hypothetical protein